MCQRVCVCVFVFGCHRLQWAKFAEDYPDTFANIAISAGTSEADHRTLASVIDRVPLVKYICLDVANGYSEHFVDRVRKTREAFPRHTIFAGNVVTGTHSRWCCRVLDGVLRCVCVCRVCPGEMVEELLLSGADVVKVGIGPGSVCTTRKQTGVGYPQLSAIIECADAAHGLGGHIIADGGCKVPGDVAKAFGGGADFVMMGGVFLLAALPFCAVLALQSHVCASACHCRLLCWV